MTPTPQDTTYDPYDSAMTATEQPQDRTYFGEVITVDAWACVLEKGVGKRAFDALHDDPSQRRTSIRLSVEVPRRDGGSYTVDQEVIDTSSEWLRYTLPSLRELLLDLRSLKGRFVQVKRVSTGQHYTNKAGEQKDRTALVFIASYPDRDAMRQAAETFYSRAQNGTPAAPNSAPAVAVAPTPARIDAGQAAERQFAEQSLPLLWQASGYDPEKFHALIGQSPMIARFFNAESPEVQALVATEPTF